VIILSVFSMVVVVPVDRALSGPRLEIPEVARVGVGVDRGVRRAEVDSTRELELVGVRSRGVGVEIEMADLLVGVLVLVDEVGVLEAGISTSTSKEALPLVEIESGSTERAWLPALLEEDGGFLLDDAADEGKGDPTGVTLELLNDLLMGVNTSPELAPAKGVG